MEQTYLTEPDESYLTEIMAYKQSFVDANDRIYGAGPLASCATGAEWLALVRQYANRATVPEHLVESTQLLLVRERDRRILGTLQIRHYFNGFLERYGGNIGYSVRPDERRKGYAARMLSGALAYCRLFGLDRVLITCAPGNEGSRRTIRANGGVYESTVRNPRDGEELERYWIAL